VLKLLSLFSLCFKGNFIVDIADERSFYCRCSIIALAQSPLEQRQILSAVNNRSKSRSYPALVLVDVLLKAVNFLTLYR